jgi:hypothetical protein
VNYENRRKKVGSGASYGKCFHVQQVLVGVATCGMGQKTKHTENGARYSQRALLRVDGAAWMVCVCRSKAADLVLLSAHWVGGVNKEEKS